MSEEHARWTEGRDAAVWAPHGIAALAATCWLDDTDRAFDDVPGRWRAVGEAAVGTDLPGEQTVRPGTEVRHANLLLRAEVRDGVVMLRVFDPAAAARRGISTILRAPFDASGVRSGVFSPDQDDTGGVVRFDLAGEARELEVKREPDGTLFAAFSDATSGSESYLFRFLRLPAPDDSGLVQVDLNRAYLPPCAFSDHYLCVFPSPRNRWAVPVRTGELVVR